MFKTFSLNIQEMHRCNFTNTNLIIALTIYLCLKYSKTTHTQFCLLLILIGALNVQKCKQKCF